MHAEILPIQCPTASIDSITSENETSPVEKISSSGIETYQFPLTMWVRK